MSFLTPFKFDKTSLFTVTIDGKVWTRAKEVIHGALGYGKSTKTAYEVRAHCSLENYAHKYQLISVRTERTPMKWPIDSQKYDFYINEEGMYELLFKSQQLQAKAFRKYCCNEMFPKIRNQLLHQRINAERHKVQEKDMQLALLNDDLTESENLVRELEFNNTGLQGEIRAKDQELAVLRQRHVPLLKNEEKNYGITIIAKNDESAEYPFISICGQHGYRKQKKRVALLKNIGSTEFADRDTPNAIVTYNVWREHGLIETDPRKPRDFRLVNIAEEQLLQLQE